MVGAVRQSAIQSINTITYHGTMDRYWKIALNQILEFGMTLLEYEATSSSQLS